MISRRSMLTTGAALAASASLARGSVAWAAVQEAAELKPLALPPPISGAERALRLAHAQVKMASKGIGAVLIEAGPSLDYYTGIQWWRSERLTGVVIPARGAAIVITPFFEGPSIKEMLQVPLEIRTWQEDEEPLKLVADFLKEQKLASMPVAFEETNRFFLEDRLKHQLPVVTIVSANPVVRAQRMIKTPAELALMQAASDITIAAFRYTWPRVREGMSPADMDAIIGEATRALGGTYGGGLVLVGEGTAYPHGTRIPLKVARGLNVLFDCGCDVHGYQSDISRSFVFGAEPTPEQRKVWNQMRKGQDIAFAAASLGAPAGSVDDAVRRAYESWGYGPGYKLPGLSHRTGHGIGMEGHEPVNLVHGETTPLAPGMCFSNEPGIYLPGKFGIRLEDCFHMTASGPKYFSRPPASLDQPV
jgi:Xaa-Pro dipeptidase